MSYHYDWVTRQIEIIAATLGYLLTGKKTHVTETNEDAGQNELYLHLTTLVRMGRICQAEDLLFEALENPNEQVLDAALRFYADLNDLLDTELQRCNFSREEILEGLQHVCHIYGIPV